MRIAVDAQTLASPDANRGIGVYLQNLLWGFTQIPGHTFHLLRWAKPLDGMPSAEQLPSTRLRVEPLSSPNDADLARYQALNAAVRRFVHAQNFDVLFNPNPLQFGVEPLSRPTPVPLVATLHDLTPLALDAPHLGFPSEPLAALYRQRLDHLCRHADHLIADSQSTLRDAVEKLGYPEEQISVVHLAADTCFRPAADRQSLQSRLQALGVGDIAGSYLLSVGGYHRKKNYENLIAALGRVDSKLLRSHPLVLAGPLNDDDWRLLHSHLERHCPELEVRRLGYVDNDQLATLYSGALALAYVSLHEGFGLPLVEAMGCGCAIVTSNTSSMPEVAGDAAKLCDPSSPDSIAEALSDILVSPDLCQDLRERALARSAVFSWKRAAQETTQALERCVSRVSVSVPATTDGSNSLPEKLLWFSPLPPQTGGVSAYSVSLLEEIRSDFDITLVTRHPAEALPASIRDLKRLSPAELQQLPPDDESLCVYNMGNNVEQCAATYSWLREHPGLTIVHDLNIHGFLLDHLVRARQAKKGKLARLLGGSPHEEEPYYQDLLLAHGEAGAREALHVLADNGLPDIARYPCHGVLTRKSLGLISHSLWGCEQLRLNADPAPVCHMPLGIEHPISPGQEAVDELRKKVGLTGTETVFVCAGFLEPSRRIDKVLHALAVLAQRGLRPRLLLAGAVNDDHRNYLENVARHLGVAEQVCFFGYLRDDKEFLSCLAVSDAVIHLRHPTNGETSATVLRALSLGRPVLVSDNDGYSELPESCCWKVDTDAAEVALLAEYLDVLSRRPEVRQAMSRAAHLHIQTHHAWPAVARRFKQIVELIWAHEGGRQRQGELLAHE